MANCAGKYKYLDRIIEGDLDVRQECIECHNYLKYDDSIYNNLVFHASKKGKYADCLMYSGATNFIIISKKALELFKTNRLTGFEEYPITIIDDKENIFDQYYILKITGNALLDYGKMGEQPKFYCKKCGYVEYSGQRPMNYKQTYLIEESWDGSDFFLDDLCTQRVVDIILKNKLKGFIITELINAYNPFNMNYINT